MKKISTLTLVFAATLISLGLIYQPGTTTTKLQFKEAKELFLEQQKLPTDTFSDHAKIITERVQIYRNRYHDFFRVVIFCSKLHLDAAEENDDYWKKYSKEWDMKDTEINHKTSIAIYAKFLSVFQKEGGLESCLFKSREGKYFTIDYNSETGNVVGIAMVK